MRLSEKQSIFALNVSKLIQYIYQEGYACTLGEALRTPQQAAMYARQGKGIEKSLHCKKLAIDLNLFKDGSYLTAYNDYEPFGKYWISLHPANRWGGHFQHLVDSDHFEMQDI